VGFGVRVDRTADLRYPQSDNTYAYYAGPVSVPAAGYCVSFMGEIVYKNDRAVYDSPGSHC
jgi:hypothetical protein